MLNCSNNVFPPKEVSFGGQDDGWRHMGKIFPRNSPKGAWIGSFKPKRQNLNITIISYFYLPKKEAGYQKSRSSSYAGRPLYNDNSNNTLAISPELLIRRTSDLRSEFGPWKALRGWSAITLKQIQHGWLPPSWKSIYNVIFQRRMFQFGRNSAAWCRMTRQLWRNGRDRNRK